MKSKKITVVILTAGLSVLTSVSAFAGQWIHSDTEGWKYVDFGWKQDSIGWWYQNLDGSYPTSTWQWIDEDRNNNGDGELANYYFDANGYLVTNTTIDDYTVNADGAWTVDGVVQVQLEDWKQFWEETKARGQAKLYNAENNPYLEDSEYQIMREEMFADLQANIDEGRLNPTNILGEKIEDRRCSVESGSIVFLTSEKEHYLDMASQIGREIIDYLYDTYGWKFESFSTCGSMASSTIGADTWNPKVKIKLKVE